MASNFAKLELPFTTRTQTNTDLHLLVHVLDWFNQFYQATIPHSIWLECQLALAEGFTNAVRHAHAGKPIDTPIDLEITLNPDAIELKIWDSGIGFDLEAYLRHLPEPSNQESDRGRGLKIIQQTADRFHYTTDQQRNCLHIVKHYGALSPSAIAVS
ncbi:MAG: ATP-binding protein [Elainella sp. Prado103]|nr:ATP-binding protein [Elainella sp. Prado103]